MARMAKARRRNKTLKPDSDLVHRLQLNGLKSLTDRELLALVGCLDLEQAGKVLDLTDGLARLARRLKDPESLQVLDPPSQAHLRAVSMATQIFPLAAT